MRPLNKDQISSPRRETEPITIPEYAAPLLLAKPSASLAVGLRARRIAFDSEEAISAMFADMLVDENGERLLSLERVPTFLEGISAESLRAIAERCFSLLAGKSGAQVPQTPSPSA